jgi:hypothetical protein
MTHQAGWLILTPPPRPRPVLATGDQHAVADLAELLEHDRQLLPRLDKLGEAPADTCGPTERRGASTAVEALIFWDRVPRMPKRETEEG